MAAHCRDARFVWNLALEQARLWRPGRASVDMAAWDRQLAEARRSFGWLSEGSSSVQQGALRDLRQAFRNRWARPDHFRAPTWRRRGQREGFVVRDLSVRVVNRRWADISVPKAGRVRFRLSRPVPADAKSARVSLDASGRWHVSVVAPPQAVDGIDRTGQVGVDLGVAASVTLSTGEQAHMPELLSPGRSQRRRRLERKKARQQKGSNRYRATKTALARLAARDADVRKDWIEKTTTSLTRRFGDPIVIEDLKVANMVRSAAGTVEAPGTNVAAKRGLNRQIHNQAWGAFRRRLTDKTTAAGVELAAVNPAGTSQRCHRCGHTAPENRESQAVLRCRRCGHSDNADANAAKNILAAGRAVTGRGGTPHAPQAQQPYETSSTQIAA